MTYSTSVCFLFEQMRPPKCKKWVFMLIQKVQRISKGQVTTLDYYSIL